MSLASNSQAASGPSQPPYAAALTPFRPMWSDKPRAWPLVFPFVSPPLGHALSPE